MNHNYYYGIRKKYLINAKFASIIERNKIMIFIGLIILTSMILSLSIISTKVTAERAVARVKLVTSVKIEKGDSLWSIASRYFSEECQDMNSYIDEIMMSNGLTSDVIYEGRYIIVPYYTVKLNNN